MTMDKVTSVKLNLSALSVYRGIMQRSVPAAFYQLLCSLNKTPDEFLEHWGAFYSLLCERGFADRLAYALTEAALYDENIFTRSAAGNTCDALPQSVLDAAAHDCRTILEAASLSSDDVLNAYTRCDDIREIAGDLPKWQNGKCAQIFDCFDGTPDSIASYYRENGCGMFARYKGFIWRDGDIRPVLNYDTIDMNDLTGYERQRQKVVDNTQAFLDGKTCNNCLLYGDMGTGKSSTVKAVANRFHHRGLRLVEMPKEQLKDFPLLVDKIAHLPMKFIIFIDDLSFQNQDQSYTTLKAVLEGGVAARPSNALIYATSNRRHIVKERLSDRAIEVDDINTRDNMQETLSLSDRFGLSVCYTVPGKKEFLEIVTAMAKQRSIKMPGDELCAAAERFALARGGRSPRCAKQFVESLFAEKHT